MKTYPCFAIILFLFMTCEKNPTNPADFKIEEISSVEVYQDIRWKDLSKIESHLDSAIIPTLTFNEKTIWPDKYKNYALEIMNKGKNPGLGVKQLHLQGTTGKGIYAAIIDQNLCLDYHPEFKDKIVEYKDFGCKQSATEGSMHGPAVTSLFVGENIGVAPNAKLYYAAVPSWKEDAKYFADALDWIIDVNIQLPNEKKIRVVSVSTAPSGENNTQFKNKEIWDQTYDRALANEILVLDCTTHHLSAAFCYFDLFNPDDITKCLPGFPGIEIPDSIYRYANFICAPASFRTVAEEYKQGEYSYFYTGRGGLSWSVPYLAGVLCLGWQINPNLSHSEIVEFIYDSAYPYNDKIKIINPLAFVDKVRNGI